MLLIAEIIHRILQLMVLVVIIQTILTYFMSPYEPIRRTLDRIVNPFLLPIQRIIPPLGGLDFSPLILIIILQLIDMLIRNLFLSML